MGATLRAIGGDFDVDAFVGGCTLPVYHLYRRGEPLSPTHPDGWWNRRSGVCLLVSDAPFNQFAKQVTDALTFLRAESEQVRRLCQWPGVEGVTLEFSIARREVAAQANNLPVELVHRQEGNLGLR